METIFETNKNGLNDNAVEMALKGLLSGRPLKKVLIIPPDASRSNSYAGPILKSLCSLLSGVQFDIMPALGTHYAMTDDEIGRMYPGIDKEKFLVHRWRDDTVKIGEVPAEFVSEISQGYLS